MGFFQSLNKLFNLVFFLNYKDILSLNQNDFLESAQFNYMHDLTWLVQQYPKENRDKPLTIIHGNSTESELRREAIDYHNVKLVKVMVIIF